VRIGASAALGDAGLMAARRITCRVHVLGDIDMGIAQHGRRRGWRCIAMTALAANELMMLLARRAWRARRITTPRRGGGLSGVDMGALRRRPASSLSLTTYFTRGGDVVCCGWRWRGAIYRNAADVAPGDGGADALGVTCVLQRLSALRLRRARSLSTGAARARGKGKENEQHRLPCA